MANVQPNDRPEYRRLDFERELASLRTDLVKLGRSFAGTLDEAEDLAQETMTKALKSWETYLPGSCMRAWTFRILHNHFLSLKRRSWRSVPTECGLLENTLVDEIDMEKRFLGIHELRQTLLIIDGLPSHMRDAIIAIAILGMSYDEGALATDCAIGTIKSRLCRARVEIQQRLSGKLAGRYPVFSKTKIPFEKIQVPEGHPFYPIQKAYDGIRAELGLDPIVRVPLSK